MINTAEDALQQYVATREHNLAFFRQKFPSIYECFREYSMRNAQVNIDTEHDSVDLVRDGQLVYQGHPKEYAKHEVKLFRECYAEGKPVNSFNGPNQYTYFFPRFFNLRATTLLRKSPLKDHILGSYPVPEHYPFMIFMGAGIGLHIQELLDQQTCENVLVVERDLDNFAASLYVVDWEKLITPFLNDPDRTFNFILGVKSEEVIYSVLWNALVGHCPVFPVMTLFYNHRGDEIYDRVSDKICEDLHVYLYSWGNYDDEMRQFNSCLHNLNDKIPTIKCPEVESGLAACIVGAGPSLNSRVGLLKKYRDNILLVSCGTALGSLHKFGIKPDIHVELESDYSVYTALKLIDDDDYLSDILVIGPAHLNPMVYTLFKQARIYFKAENPSGWLFGGNETRLYEGTPTCTNAGVSLIMHLGIPEIYLFGLDYAISTDSGEMHASGTIYSSPNASDHLKKGDQYSSEHLIKIAGANGEEVSTTPIYFSSKRRMDHLLGSTLNRSTVYNCSDGAALENCEWLSQKRFSENMEEKKRQPKSYIKALLGISETIPSDLVSQRTAQLHNSLEVLSQRIKSVLENGLDTDIGCLRVCSHINRIMEQECAKDEPPTYFFIRGTIRHFLFIGLTHGLSLTSSEQKKQFLSDWREDFSKFLDEMIVHFGDVVSRAQLDLSQDSWVTRSLNDPE